MGAIEWYKTVHQRQGWRLVTSIWLHAGIFHLIANMLTLLLIGICLERQRGFGNFSLNNDLNACSFYMLMLLLLLLLHAVRTAVIYLLSGFGGSILLSLFIRGSISVGASGAGFGVLGALLSELFTNWSKVSNKVNIY